MDLNGVQSLPLKPLDLSRHPAATDLKPLDLSSRDGVPMRPGGSLEALTAASPASDRLNLEKQAQVFVATAFFGTLLKQMRESPFKSDLFSGGRGGQAFGSMYDQELAQRMARGAGNKLVHAIVRSLEAKKEYARQSRELRMMRSGEGASERSDPNATSPQSSLSRHAIAA